MQRRCRSLRSHPWAAGAALAALAVLMLGVMTTVAFATVTTYTITPTAGANGAITPAAPQTVVSGNDSTFTITPDSGYYIATLTVDTVATAPVDSYTFTNVVADHTIAATFKALSPIETFDHNPHLVLSAQNPDVSHDETAMGAWYLGYDWYGPAGFTKALFDGGNRLRISIAAADYHAFDSGNPLWDYYNKQGRAYNVATTTVIAADLYVPSTWVTDDRYAALWSTAVDSAGAETGVPSFKFDADTGGTHGFYVWANSAWHYVGFPGAHGYGEWYSLRIQINPASGSYPGSVTYYIDDALVYVDSYTDDPAMASCVGLSNVRLFAWNMGQSYDVYWDNVVPVPPAAPYTIATSAGSGGSIVPPNPTVDFGDDSILAVTPDIGHHIVDVLKDSVSIGASSSVTFSDVMTAGHTLSATFARTRPTLTITRCPKRVRHGHAFQMRGRVTPIFSSIQITRYRYVHHKWHSYGRYNQKGRADGTWIDNVSTNHKGSWKFVVRAHGLSATSYVTAY